MRSPENGPGHSTPLTSPSCHQSHLLCSAFYHNDLQPVCLSSSFIFAAFSRSFLSFSSLFSLFFLTARQVAKCFFADLTVSGWTLAHSSSSRALFRVRFASWHLLQDIYLTSFAFGIPFSSLTFLRLSRTGTVSKMLSCPGKFLGSDMSATIRSYEVRHGSYALGTFLHSSYLLCLRDSTYWPNPNRVKSIRAIVRK